MNDIIHLLPDSVANQIAAGEVVQRPASVVKELMENAVDAGATRIKVNVSDGGRTLVQVIDDGKGMSETDARLAFERHATSKISCANDLFSISTMGFRGEALASIAAVAEVELLTRRPCDELGVRLVISASKMECQEPVVTPVGCNFKVKNLFFNIPARRKFLKTTQTELNNIVTEFERVALVNCNVEFTLTHNGSEMISLPPSSFRQRIVNLFGKKINSHLIEVGIESPLINIKGFVGTPESSKKKGAQQFFFVNGRYMRNPYFAKAVTEAYGAILPQGEQVPFFLCFDVDSSRIDVNIHPTKTEIKFEDEQSLWKIISAAVRESLGRFNATPSLDFDDEGIPEIPVMDISPSGTVPVSAPKIKYTPGYNPFKSGAGNGKPARKSWELLYEGVQGEEKPLDLSPFEDSCCSEPSLYPDSEPGGEVLVHEEYVPLTQYKAQYILIPVKSGLMWVHQHRAHVRVLYEKYRTQLAGHSAVSQRLLFPERLELSVNEAVALESVAGEFSALGFDIAPLGGNTYAINGMPAGTEGLSYAELLLELLHCVMEGTHEAKDNICDRIANSMAKQVAIVKGLVLSADEMKALIDDLFRCSMPSRTPDGHLVVYIMPDSDIDHHFNKR